MAQYLFFISRHEKRSLKVLTFPLRALGSHSFNLSISSLSNPPLFQFHHKMNGASIFLVVLQKSAPPWNNRLDGLEDDFLNTIFPNHIHAGGDFKAFLWDKKGFDDTLTPTCLCELHFSPKAHDFSEGRKSHQSLGMCFTVQGENIDRKAARKTAAFL